MWSAFKSVPLTRTERVRPLPCDRAAHSSRRARPDKVAAEEVPDYCELLTRYFVRLNPNKVANVGALLAHYAGRELELFEKLEDKYGAPVFARAAAKSNGDIYDRLTDCSKYTGAHKRGDAAQSAL